MKTARRQFFLILAKNRFKRGLKSISMNEHEMKKSLTPLPLVKPESPESAKSESSVESEMQKSLTP